MSEARKPLEFLLPEPPTLSRCSDRSCRAEIVWMVTASGKNMPLSWKTVRLREDGVRVAQSHWSDCANPPKFRRKAER